MVTQSVGRQALPEHCLMHLPAKSLSCLAGIGLAIMLKVFQDLSLSAFGCSAAPGTFRLYSNCASVHALSRYSLSGQLQQLGLGSADGCSTRLWLCFEQM